MKRIYLIDCPGVVHPSPEDTETDIILKGVVRVENLALAEDHIPVVLERVKPEYMKQTYGIHSWENHVDFLEQLARKSGKLLKGGEPDICSVSKMILNDWIRGKIPYFKMPPMEPKSTDNEDLVEIKQIFKNIVVSSAFSSADMKAPVDETANEAAAADETTSEQEQVPDWDDVFQNVVGEEEAVHPGSSDSVPEENETTVVQEENEIDSELEMSESESESVVQEAESSNSRKTKGSSEVDVSEKKHEKKRMTTNKRKVGVNYYDTANVKNRNRSKVKPVDPHTLQKKLRKH
jgi:nuclear GTP-binding protein